MNSQPTSIQDHARKRLLGRGVSMLLRLAVVAACFVYIFHDLDIQKAYGILEKYRIMPVLLAPLYLAATIVPPAMRFRFLMGCRLGLWDAYKAILLGLGLNVVLPARLGEVAKALYASDRAKTPAAFGFSMVFWERLFDLQALCAMTITVAAVYGKDVLVLPLAAVVAGIWSLVVVQRLWPVIGWRIAGLVPTERAKGLLRDFLDALGKSSGGRFFLGLSAHTLFIWVWYPGFYAIVLNAAAGMHLSASQVMLVFLTAALGAAIPSSPGALGVYEASVYLGLAWCGIGREEAVAAALALRCLMFLPLAVGGAVVMAGANINLNNLRISLQSMEKNREQQPEDPAGAGETISRVQQ